MNQIEINDMTLSYPEEFHEMDEREKAGFRFYKDNPGICLTNPEKHILVTVGFKKSGIASLLLDTDNVAKQAEKNISVSMKPNGYCLERFTDCSIADKKASGYRYHYTAQDIAMTGETIVVKHNKVFYYLNFYARTELLEDSLEIWANMLAAVRWHK